MAGYNEDDLGRRWPKTHPREAGPTWTQTSTLLAMRLHCKGCIFWQGGYWEYKLPWGVCKRHAPVVPTTDDMRRETEGGSYGIAGIFPATHEDDWCGEFMPAPTEP